MNIEAVHGIRVRLQRRWRRLRGASAHNANYASRTLIAFIYSEPTCRTAVERLEAQFPTLNTTIDDVLEGRARSTGESEAEGAAMGWLLLKAAADPQRPDGTWSDIAEHFDGLGDAIEHYVEPLFDYLDEMLDDRAEFLTALLRFRQWAEWFGHERIADVIAAEDRRVAQEGGRRQVERRLQQLMFERLFLDGVSLVSDVSREPDCGVGRPDFLFTFRGRPIVTEVKLFPGSGGVPGLVAGFGQILTYMDTYQAGAGYLVIFNSDLRGLRCGWAANHGGVPLVQVGDKTVYVMVVAATGDDRSASDRGPADPVLLSANALHPLGG
jgi:hypothetical protein